MNVVRVLTVVVSAKRAERPDRGRLCLFVTKACQNTMATFISYLFLIDKWCADNILASKEAHADNTNKKHNLNLPLVMNFLLLPYLPRFYIHLFLIISSKLKSSKDLNKSVISAPRSFAISIMHSSIKWMSANDFVCSIILCSI